MKKAVNRFPHTSRRRRRGDKTADMLLALLRALGGLLFNREGRKETRSNECGTVLLGRNRFPFRSLSHRVLIIAILLTTAAMQSAAQEGALTLREAIRVGLEQNNAVKIAAVEREKGENSVSIGAAGFLPMLDASAGLNGSLSNTKQEYVSGETVERNGAGSRGYFAGVDLSWRLFDGLGSFARLDLLEGARDRSIVLERREREDLAVEIAATYFDLVRLERLADVQREAIALSLARRDLATARVETGEGIRFELTQAQVDLDADSAALLRTGLFITDARIRLNRLMNRPPLTPVAPADAITLGRPLPAIDELRTQMLGQNTEVRAAVIEGELARASRRLAVSESYPTLTANVGYDLAGSESDASFVLSNRTSGINYNLIASINLFNGFITKQRIENAELDIRRSELLYADAVAESEAILASFYRQYVEQAQLAEFERTRVEGARENLRLAGDRLELGVATPLEVRAAQAAFVEAENRLVQAEYETVLLELSLWRISGEVLFLAE